MLDDTLAEAHATLGAVLTSCYYGQSAAELEFLRALELNPNYGKVGNSYGVYRVCIGRLDEAVAESAEHAGSALLSVMVRPM